MGFQRKKATWRVRGEDITLGVRTLLAGRVEFVRGPQSAKVDPSALLDEAREIEAAQVDFVELNPGPRRLSDRIPSADEELRRLVPALRKIGPRLAVPISVLTAHAETARRSIDLGASIVHDLTGLSLDKHLASVVNETDAALILGHMRGTPAQWPRLDPLRRLAETLRTDLQASLLRAHGAGIDRRRIALDPGLEQGKRGHENFDILRSLDVLVPSDQGIYVNLAGKRFLVESVKAGQAEKQAALAVAATLALESGAHILAVERFDLIREVVAVADRIYRDDDAAGYAA